MNTIKTYDADESASTRLAVWKWTIEYAKTHPFGGGFNAYLGNHIRYDLKTSPDAGSAGAPAAAATPKVEVDKARAYHSAYFEMLGEQGYFGLALWLAINLIGIVRMEVVRRRYRDPDGAFGWAGPLAAALQSGHIVYLLGAAFIAIAFQPFIYMLIGAQIGLDTYLARKRSEESFRPMRRATPAASA
jgi:O-antigen ligase